MIMGGFNLWIEQLVLWVQIQSVLVWEEFEHADLEVTRSMVETTLKPQIISWTWLINLLCKING